MASCPTAKCTSGALEYQHSDLCFFGKKYPFFFTAEVAENAEKKDKIIWSAIALSSKDRGMMPLCSVAAHEGDDPKARMGYQTYSR